MMVDAGSQRGTINVGEKEIIHNVFEFDNRSASEVMTHRVDVIMLRLKDSEAGWEEALLGSRHSYYPVCDTGPDDISGVLSAKDYFRLADRRRETLMAQAVRPAVFIPESVKTDVLFRKMKRNRNHFAVVLDEYGGMSGIVTMNDLLEQLVGDLDDEDSGPPERPLIEKLAGGRWRFDGSAPLEKVGRALEVPLPVEDYDTFGGYVFSLLGEVPEDGFTAELDEGELHISIEEVKERRLETALVTLKTSGKTP